MSLARHAWMTWVIFALACDSGGSSSEKSFPLNDGGASTDSGPADAAHPVSSDAGDAGAPRLDMGVTFSPIGFGGAFEVWSPNRPAFYAAATTHGRVVAFHVGWRDGGMPRPACGSSPGLVSLIKADAASNPFTLSIVLGWSSGDGAPDLACEPDTGDNSWSNPTTRAKYKELAVTIATELHPAYLYLGNEVNSWYLGHAAGWPAWVTELDEVTKAVHVASPTTIVGTVFQLDRMKGAGKKNGWSDPPHFSLIDDVVGKVDIVGVTAYPFFDSDTAMAVPSDYFSEVLTHWSGPVALTETAWRAEPGTPYAGSAAEQSAWAGRLFDLLPAPRLRYAVWLFLTDPDPKANQAAFLTTGLRDPAGAPRAVDGAWEALVKTRQSP